MISGSSPSTERSIRVVTQLRELEQLLLDHREARALELQIELVRQTIALIEADDNPPPVHHVLDRSGS